MDDRRFMRIAKALADPTRFAILERIAAEPDVACQRLIEAFAVTPATISHHLKELGGADLVEMRREGKCGFLTLRPDVFAAYQQELGRRLGGPKKPRRRA
jgi:ArsR family transcriptional regulator, arsenate/arsenite/antimonite-responsive transcriptional repressor